MCRAARPTRLEAGGGLRLRGRRQGKAMSSQEYDIEKETAASPGMLEKTHSG